MTCFYSNETNAENLLELNRMNKGLTRISRRVQLEITILNDLHNCSPTMLCVVLIGAAFCGTIAAT